jgi:hypothetical protein
LVTPKTSQATTPRESAVGRAPNGTGLALTTLMLVKAHE